MFEEMADAFKPNNTQPDMDSSYSCFAESICNNIVNLQPEPDFRASGFIGRNAQRNSKIEFE